MTDKEYNICVDEYADNVYRFIYKNLQHEHDARDIVQSAFEKMWIHREEVIVEKRKSYLFTVAYHQMIDHIRKNKRISHREDMAVEAGAAGTSYNTGRILQEALATLSERDKSLVMLKDYEGYNYKEIGEITGLNDSQVKVYLHRARLQLKDYIVKIENVL